MIEELSLSNHTFHSSILRAYDIRGIVEETLSTDDAYWIGRVFGHIIHENKRRSIAIGRDGRLSSPALSFSLSQGFLDAGLDVYDVGLCPTPMLYFAEYTLPVDGAVMVTGSHNPPTHNGFKFSLMKKPFFGDSILSFAERIKGPLCEGQGRLVQRDINADYIQRLLRDFKELKSLTIAWDPGNGSTCQILKKLVKQLPGKHILLNDEIDGTFPSHPPDPSKAENMKQLKDAVLKHQCDLGIAFDGDGDRAAALDSQGRHFNGDQLFLLYATDLLSRHPKSTVIADVKTSQGVFDRIADHQGNPLMWKTGHSHIKEKMRETGTLLAGEMSGHFFFKENYYGFDDGLYAALKLVDIISTTGTPLSNMYDSLPKLYASPEIHISCSSEQKFAIPLQICETIKCQGVTYHDIDGIRVQTDEGWWLLRASNTQDVLVARCEGYSQEALDNLKTQLRTYLVPHHLSF